MASITASSVLALGWVSGCSVLYDLETKQCSADADCAALGGLFEGLACIDNLCQEPPITGCQSNAQCIDEQGFGFDPWACVEQEAEEGSVRRSRECVKLTTTECPTMLPLGDGELYLEILRSENPLILAGSGLIGGTTLLDQRLRNYNLALTELENQNGGLPSTRKVLMIGCSSTFEEEGSFERQMDHLINQLKVPGVASSYIAEDLQRAFNEYGKDAQTFFMSALESDVTLGAMQDDGLIWHIGPGVDVLAQAYAPLLTRTLAHLGIAERTDVKVAVVTTTNIRFLSNMAPGIERAPEEFGLSFNGTTVADNRDNLGTYIRVGISADATSDISTQIESILTLQPNVIISLADQQFVQRIVTAVETRWPTGGPPKPFYLLSPFNFGDSALRNMMQTNTSLQARIAGVNGPAPDTPLRDSYVSAYTTAYPDYEPGDLNYENFYDAAYYLLYAAAAAGQNIDNGQSLRVGMNRLLTGPANDVGAPGMSNAMSILASPSSSIRLNGVLGPPDWNPINGTRRSYGSVWCIGTDREYKPDVLLYAANDANPTQASLTGTFPCIPDF
jgi:hypothetical protein